ncbi:uncharacterized protein LOC107794081 [Nicotiana tabacum]|uniref:Uncharacterized protein LOC107794081 n=2 Tax=Nicotiana TaxID=4085 RepID=A0A1S4A5U4_TOBAC|nr:PREDICTED: uncharacterized protein LOC104235271 [Nicotiana sylvestris]XP_016472022.1 PREDICTED: uncharacterized protein LOC107794081 [Nicotiana tabacum]
MMIAIERARREKLAGGCVTTVVLVDGKKIDLEKLISNHGTEMLNRENLAVEGWPSVTRGKRQKICPESVTRKNPVDGGGLESLFVPLDMKKKLELESQMQKHREEQIAQGGCLLEWPLNPYCTCDPSSSCHEDKSPIFSLPYGALEEHCPDFEPIWLTYFCQIRQTHSFDLDVHPGPSLCAGIAPYNFKKDVGLLMELADRAIQEYNEKERNVFKYKALKIEKVNRSVTMYFEYWMTVKVLNLTLGTPIETFQIHAAKNRRNADDPIIYFCRPKEEATDGLAPYCDACFCKLRGEACQGGRDKAVEL